MNDNTLDRNDISIKRALAMYRINGIFIEEQEGDIITIEQRTLGNSLTAILSQKELRDRARALYPESRFKIRPITYKIEQDKVTPEWIKEQMELYNIKQKDLAHQLGFNLSEISLFINGERSLSRGVKSAFFYYFLSRKIQKELSEDINYLEKRLEDLNTL